MIGADDIELITPERIRECMAPIWQSIPSTAKKARTYTQKIFQWVIALHKRSNRENPAMMSGALGVLMEPLQKNKKPKQHHAACAVEELPRLIAEIHGYNSMSARACEFAILTATRSQAVRLARWEEFDLEKGVWVIPLEHDKIKAFTELHAQRSVRGRRMTLWATTAASIKRPWSFACCIRRTMPMTVLMTARR